MYTFPTTPGESTVPFIHRGGKNTTAQKSRAAVPRPHSQQAADMGFEPLHGPFSNSQVSLAGCVTRTPGPSLGLRLVQARSTTKARAALSSPTSFHLLITGLIISRIRLNTHRRGTHRETIPRRRHPAPRAGGHGAASPWAAWDRLGGSETQRGLETQQGWHSRAPGNSEVTQKQRGSPKGGGCLSQLQGSGKG